MRQAFFTPAAREELTGAYSWYERESTGLGGRFLAAVDDLIERMADNPLQFPLIYKKIRRALLPRFPYALLFVEDKDGGLTVVACFHGSRDPMQWRRRV